MSEAERIVQMGVQVTEGLGAVTAPMSAAPPLTKCWTRFAITCPARTWCSSPPVWAAAPAQPFRPAAVDPGGLSRSCCANRRQAHLSEVSPQEASPTKGRANSRDVCSQVRGDGGDERVPALLARRIGEPVAFPAPEIPSAGRAGRASPPGDARAGRRTATGSRHSSASWSPAAPYSPPALRSRSNKAGARADSLLPYRSSPTGRHSPGTSAPFRTSEETVRTSEFSTVAFFGPCQPLPKPPQGRCHRSPRLKPRCPRWARSEHREFGIRREVSGGITSS